jgi:hypothetical protein
MKPRSAIKTPDPTTEFDHVGHHHQPVLPSGVQEIRRRRAKAADAVGLNAYSAGTLNR